MRILLSFAVALVATSAVVQGQSISCDLLAIEIGLDANGRSTVTISPPPAVSGYSAPVSISYFNIDGNNGNTMSQGGPMSASLDAHSFTLSSNDITRLLAFSTDNINNNNNRQCPFSLPAVPDSVCNPNPCENGGACSPSGNSFQCTCPAGFSGSQCQISTGGNACSNNPCQNGGTCTLLGNSFQCACPTGFSGSQCQISTGGNACSNNPCQNGGTCTLFGNSFQCTCPTGFAGNQCQTNTGGGGGSPCFNNPCQNGGVCMSTSSSTFFCDCSAGFVGPRCTVSTGQVTTCNPSPCENGGQCQATGGSPGFQCTCSGGYAGDQCQFSPAEQCSAGSEGAVACGTRTCLNRNVPGEPSFVCVCTSAFVMGHDCSVGSDNRILVQCYGQTCKRRVDRLGQSMNYFESPDFPNPYEDRLRALYLLYLPGVSEIRFTWDQRAFGIENEKDELYVASGLQFDFADLKGKLGTPLDINFFENFNASNIGQTTPRDFTVQGDTVWMYFLTDKNIMMPGWRLYWEITDTQPPQATCPADILETVPLGQSGKTVTWTEPQAFDDSGITPTLISRSHTPGTFFQEGVLTTVSYLWRDGAGNEGGCDFTVFINTVDEVPPVVTVPADIVVFTPCNTGGRVVQYTEPTAVDNSGTVNLASRTHTPGTFFIIGDTVVTYRFIDGSGNSASGSFTVTVIEQDTTAPICTPPSDISQSIPLGTGGRTSITWPPPQVSDECSQVTLVSSSHSSGDDFGVGTTQVTYVYRDEAGNTVSCGFSVTIGEFDNVPPVATCPDDIRQEIDLGTGSVFVSWIEATANDNSGIANLVSRSHTPNTPFETGLTTVTYTFEDPSGNQGTCSFNILIIEVDRLPPVVICPTDIVEQIALGQFGRSINYDDPETSDNSGSVTLVSQSHRSGQFFQIGTTTVEYEYRDPSGNTNSCSFTVTIIEVDTVPPVINGLDDITVTTPCNTGGRTVTWTEPTATDNSGQANLASRTHTPGQFFPVGAPTTVTYRFSDPSGNSATTSFTVTVIEVDNTPPSCIPPNDITRTIPLGSAGGRTVVTWTENRQTDDCSQVTLVSQSHQSGAEFNVGTTQVSYVYRDEAGNTQQCSFTITVVEVDTVDPVCGSCGQDVVREIGLNIGSDNVVFTECTATDNSGIVNLVSRSHRPGQSFPVGVTQVSYTFEDPSQNQAVCIFNVRVLEVDTVPPQCVPRVIQDVTQTIPIGTFGTSIPFPEPRAQDNSGTANLQTRSHTPGAFFQVGTTEVCYTFADPSQNTVDCCFNVIIIEVDTIPPVVTCPNDVTVTTACNTGGTTDVTWLPATATDNSGTANLNSQTHQPGQFFRIGTTDVTYTYSDQSGNSASCTFTVNVIEVDPIPPVCTPPQDIVRTIPLGTSPTVITWTEPRATDNCGQATLQSRTHQPGDQFGTGITTVTYVFADQSQNQVSCGFTITITEVDGVRPICTCGDDMSQTVPLNAGGANVVFTECTATDNSGSVSLTSRSHRPGQRFDTGITDVVYVFSDQSGNEVTCGLTVTVIEVDSTPPRCLPSQDVTQTIPLGTFGTSVQFTEPRAQDNSGTANLQTRTHTPGGFFQVGTTEVCYTFADPSQNTVQCCFDVTIIEVDEIPPVVTCPSDATFTTACNTGGTTDVTWQPATATDNSGTANLNSQTHQPGQFFRIGTTDVTYTFSDQSGNTASCTFTVNVIEVDSTPPVCTPPQDIARTIPLGTSPTVITWAEPRATDNCGQATLQSRTYQSGDQFGTGTTTVTYVFADQSQNQVSCSFTITITEVDAVRPICTCGDDVSQTIPLNVGGANVVFTECTATDNSGSVSLTSRSHRPGQRFDVGITDVVYVFSDSSANEVTCGLTVTVIEVDTMPPRCIPPVSNDVTQTIPLGRFGTSVQFTEPRAQDNSGTANLQTRTHTPGGFFQVGTTEVCYTFADPSQNTVDCCFNVIIIEVDEIPPVVTCPSDVTFTTACNTGGTTDVTWQPATATDNSGTANLNSQTHTPGQFFRIGTTDVTYTFSDQSGNTASCTFTVNVIEVDSTPPVCTPPQDITRTIPLGTSPTVITWTEPRATDNCGQATLQSRTYQPGDQFGTGTTTVTYVFADQSQNQVSCSFTITITEVDAVRPICTCGEDVSQTVPLNVGGANVVFTECTATDNSGSVSLTSRSHRPGQRFDVGITDVVYTFSDSSGNEVTCGLTVTVFEVDTMPPRCIPPVSNDVTQTIPLGTFGTSVQFTEPMAQDNSGTANLQTRTHTPGGFFQVGTTEVCYTFADPSQNTVQCCFDVIIIEVDEIPPVVTCPNDATFTTACNTGGTLDVTWQPATATDNSGTANLISQTHTPGQFFQIGTTDVTYRFSDQSGNTASCTFTINVIEVDTTPPVCTPPQDIVRTIPLGTSPTVITWTEPRATDNCGQATLQSRTYQPGDQFGTGTTTVTYVFADQSQNQVSCSFTITITEVDAVRPVCTCGEDMSQTVPLNVGGANVVFTECTATDNSGSVSLTSRSHRPGQRFDVGITDVVYVFSDQSGNEVTCGLTVTVIEVDTSPPTCVPRVIQDVTETIPIGTFGTSVQFTEPRAQDNSGTANLQTRTHTPGAFFQVGTTEVCYTFADPSQNTVQCCFDVIIIEVDTIPPVVTCPNDVTVTTACNTGGTTDVTWLPATATDNSGTANLNSQTHQPGQFFRIGATDVTYTFSDQSGNSASCTFTVNVIEVDTTPPVCTPPQDIVRTIPLGTSPTVITWTEPRATDNCGQATLQSRTYQPGDQFGTGTTTVTYVFADQSQNQVSCSFTITITEVDAVRPVCTCGEDMSQTVPLNVGGANVVFTECTATDNSGSVSLTSRSHRPGQRFDVGITDVVYTFSDSSGNEVTCGLTVTVIEVDTSPPTCVPRVIQDVTETIPIGTFGTSVQFTEPRAQDNSGTANLQTRTHTPGAFFQVGSTEVCYTFADPSQNTVQCCFDVIIIEVDTIPPVVTCPNDVTVTTACNTGGTTDVTWLPATATDNSGTANLNSQTHQPGQFFRIGTTDVTYTFSDQSGNSASCTFTVNVIEVDPTPPVCTPPQDIARTIPLGTSPTVITWTEPRATDNCGQATLQSRTYQPGDQFGTGTTTVTYVFADQSQNQVSCSFTITITEVDAVRPVCTCGEDMSQTVPLNAGGANVVFTECTATDNSGSVSLTSRSHRPGQRFDTGITDVVYVFSDSSGNEVTCGLTVTVIEVDTMPPRCLPTNDVSQTIPIGTFGTSVQFTEPRAQDNSGTANLQTRTHTPGGFFQVGTTEVCYTFADPSQNTVQCCFDVTIIEVDTIPPIVTCPNDATFTTACNTGGTLDATWQPATATDNSGTANLNSQTHTPGQFFVIGTTDVTYTFSDPSGNTASCTFTVNVIEVDPTPPVCTPPQDIARTIPLGTSPTVITWAEPRATDNCGQVTLQSRTYQSGDQFGTGTTTVTYVFADQSQNQVSCSFTITITEVDTVRPVCTCGEDMSQTVPLNVGGANVVFTECTATDNSGSVSLTSRSHRPGQRFDVGITDVVYVFSDPSGNEVTCGLTVTVIEVDTSPPTCVPRVIQDVTETIPIGTFGTSVQFTEPRAQDNSGTANLQTRTHTPGAFFQVGSTEVCYTFADPSQNTVQCCFDVIIIEVDTVPPVVTCPRDQTVTTACNTGGTTDVTWLPATATDNSGTANLISQTHQAGQFFFRIGDTEVTYTFSDPSGNTASCTFEITVIEVDPIPPVCTPPNDISQTISLGTGGTTVSWAEPTVTDNCGQATLRSRTHTPGSFFNTGTTLVTYVFEDAAGNTVSCSFEVVIDEVDRIPPVCVCGDDVRETIPLNAGGTNVRFTECTATDNSNSVSLVDRSHAPNQRFNTGTTRVEYTFSDSSGNEVTCGFNIIIIEVDTIPPFCVPRNIPDVRQNVDLGLFGVPVQFTEPGADDNSGTANLQTRTHTPGAFFQVGTTQVCYTFADPSQNTVECCFNVIISEVDNVPPVPTCPTDITRTIDINTGGTTVDFNDATAVDNSGTANLVSQTHRSGNFFGVGTTEVTFTFADPSGNTASCSFTITIIEIDDEIPNIVFCPQPISRTISIGTGGGVTVTWSEPIVFDNSQQVTIESQSHTSGDFFSPGVAEVVYVFIDPSSNTATCRFTVTVEEVDTDPPIPDCPSDQSVTIPLASPPGSGRTPVTWILPRATDNSGQATIASNTHSSGDSFSTGTTVVTYVFVDPSQNRATCSWVITVIEVDTVPPVCTCANDVSQTTPLNTNGAIVNFQPCTATDNSNSVTLTSASHSPGTRFQPGVTEVVYIFSDPSDNSVTCGFRVTIIEVDEIPPQVINCPSDITDTVDFGQAGKTVSWTEPTSQDNSGTSTMTNRSHRPNSFFSIGVTEVTYTFSDPSGNTASCSFTITIIEVDNEPPVARCPANVRLTILTGLGGAEVDWDEAVATDNSGTATLASRTHTPGSYFPIGDTTVRYTFTDPSSNIGSCTFSIIITEANPCQPQPCLNGGTCVIETPTTYTCLCPECFSGDICQDGADACNNHQCGNGGACVPFSGSCTQYFCECNDCFSGRFCTEQSDPCENHQCRNGAQCQSDPNDCNEYICICPACFSGQFCQNSFDACTDNRCANGAQCVQTPNGGCTEYTCACSGCFSGPFCNEMRDPCTGNPCLNGALCSPLTLNCYAYSCECRGCFTGYNCEVAIPNPCINNPCVNGGDCNVISGECFAYSCRCPSGFTGINCELIVTVNQNPCTSFPCQNGGSCLTIDATYYICVCPEAYLGINCQTQRTTQINLDSCASNPCINGQCYNSFHSNSAPNNNFFIGQYTCVCERGFTGSNCALRTFDIPQLDICNVGNRPPCRNGGVCFNDYHSYDQDVDYFCECRPGFVGHNCETISVNPCNSSPCRNGGTCNNFNTFFQCSCPSGYTGTVCQIPIGADRQPPVVQNCPPSQYFFTTSGGAQATWTEPTATDSQDPNPRLLRQSHNPPQFFQLGTTAVTYVFVDNANNAATCTFFITVYSMDSDNIPPVITGCPNGETTQVPPGATGGVVRWTEPQATDNSNASPARVRSHTPGSRFPVGTTRVTYTFTDGAGNAATCQFNVVVNAGIDNVPPQITSCPTNGVSVQISSTASSGVATWTVPQATDNSGITPQRTQTHSPGQSFPVGSTRVTYTFTDGSQNSATCSFNVFVTRDTVVDTTAPVILNCPQNIVRFVAPGTSFELIEWEMPIATDESGPPELAFSSVEEPRVLFQVGSGPIAIRYVFSDAAGNQATCSFEVSAQIGGGDVTPPEIRNCPTRVQVQVPPGSSSGVATWINPTATDDSGQSPQRTQTHTSGTSFPVGVTSVTITFTDGSGNSARCNFDVTIIVSGVGDITPPTLTFCPNDIIASAPQGSSFVSISWTLPTATDDSGVATLQSGSPFGTLATSQFFGVGMTNIVNAIYTFTDPAGNEATCEFRIGAIVNPPNPCNVVPCQNGGQCSQITNSFECSCPSGFTGNRCQTPTAGDACSNNPCQNGGTCFLQGNTFRCQCLPGFTGQTCQTREDNACSSSPCLNGGQCQVFNTGQGGQIFFCQCQAPFTGTRCENGGVNPCSPNPCQNNGVCSVRGDGSSFSCTCTNQFLGDRCQIQDLQPPIVTNCPQSITQPTTQGSNTALVTFNAPTVTDNSGEAFVAYTSQGQSLNVVDINQGQFQATFPLGLTTVTVQATDNAGNTNSQCTFTVTIVAITAPTVNCPRVATSSSGTVTYTPTVSNFNNQNNIQITYSNTNQLANDNNVFIETIPLFRTPHDVGVLPAGQNVVRVTASNNVESAECTFTYFRTAIQCPTVPSSSSLSVTFDRPTYTFPNNADVQTISYERNGQIFLTLPITQNQHTLTGFSTGSTEVTVSTSDRSGNSASCIFTYTVTTDPVGNPCSSNPCPAGTECFYTTQLYICQRNPCSSSPCDESFQQCFYTTIPSMYICIPDAAGRKRRDIEAVELTECPCINGMCDRRMYGTTCVCQEGFTGMFCEEPVRVPVVESCRPNPCANNGTCFDLSTQEGGRLGDYACKCTSEWEGPDCTEPVQHTYNGLRPVYKDQSIINWTVGITVGALIIVIIVFALIICRFVPNTKHNILLGKLQRADEVAVVQ